jgi:hypothetical protein
MSSSEGSTGSSSSGASAASFLFVAISAGRTARGGPEEAAWAERLSFNAGNVERETRPRKGSRGRSACCSVISSDVVAVIIVASSCCEIYRRRWVRVERRHAGRVIVRNNRCGWSLSRATAKPSLCGVILLGAFLLVVDRDITNTHARNRPPLSRLPRQLPNRHQAEPAGRSRCRMTRR